MMIGLLLHIFVLMLVFMVCNPGIANCGLVHTFNKGHEFIVMEPMFEEKYFDQFIDHFNFNSNGNHSYKQRYLITGGLIYYWVSF